MKCCTWTVDDVGGDDVWETSCGHSFQFNEGGPKENGLQFCGYCGERLLEAHTSWLRRDDAEAEAR